MVKIGIFGNTNNYPYNLALGLRRLGINAVLVVNRKELLHRPESKHPELAGKYPDWILDCSDIAEEEFEVESYRTEPVLDFLWQGSSGLILNHLGPSLHASLGLPSISLLTGSDLTYYASYEAEDARIETWDAFYRARPGAHLRRRKWRQLVDRQREGILSSHAVSFAPLGMIPECDKLLADIGVENSKRIFVYQADTHMLGASPPRLREEIRIFNGARLNWKEPLPPGFTKQDNKRTDLLLQGFAQFLSLGGKGKLVLVEKGLDVEATKQMAQILGLASKIKWLPEMSLSAFHQQVCEADVVCDQLGPSFPGMAGLDAMALGRPVIGNFRMDILGPAFPEPWPVCNCESADSVAVTLLALERSSDLRRNLGANARRFAERHLSAEANAMTCLQRLVDP